MLQVVLSGVASSVNRRSITIDHTLVGASDSTNFPVLVSGTYAYLKTAANGGLVQNTCTQSLYALTVPADLTFSTDLAGTSLIPWEFETYDAATGLVNIWVQVPTVSHTSDTVIYMRYGNASITTFQGGAAGAVWDGNFKLVAHMGAPASFSGDDATGINTVINNGVSASTGKIGGAGSYASGGTNYLDYGTTSNSAVNPVTVSLWVKHTAAINNPSQLVTNGYNGSSTAWAIQPTDASGHIGWQTFIFPTSHGVTSAATISTAAWAHLVATYDGTRYRLYINGTEDANSPVTDTAPANYARNVMVGAVDINGAPGQYFLGGLIDEVRISQAVRTASWVQAEYNNQNDPASFYAVSSLL